MKKGYGLVLFLLCGIAMQGQQYIIRYDLAGENVNYLRIKGKDTAAAPVILLSKTNRVGLQLVNTANSYQRQVKLIDRVEIREKVIIPGVGSEVMTNLTSNLTGADLKEFNLSEIFKNPGNKDIEIMTDNTRKQAIQKEFINRYNNFSAAYAKWQKALQFEMDCRVLWKDLAELRYSMEYPATEIKKQAREKTNAVIPDIGDNAAALMAEARKLGPQAMFNQLKQSYTDLAMVYTALKEVDSKSSAAEYLVLEAEKTMTAAGRSSSNSDDIINRITELYRLILNDSYVQLTPVEISRKTIMAEISFIPLIDSATAALINMKPLDTIKRLIPVYKKEPLRFKNTFGFSFVSFAENRWHYYITPDSIVAKEPADQFQPVVVTYLHFYSPRDKGFRWGGSFGAGIPVGGDNTKLNIMLGLSTFLGKNDPVCITAGVSGTQLKKISGVNVGDKINATELNDRNYSSVYRVGYFISLTFNPGSLNLND